MVYGRLNNSNETAGLQPPLIYIYIETILFWTISNHYMYTTCKVYVHKLQTKRGEIYESKMNVNI